MKKEIKSFKGVDINIMCILNPKKPLSEKDWKWSIDLWGDYNSNTELICEAFKKGGKKIQSDLFYFLREYYDLFILEKEFQKGNLTMYHGTRQALSLIISDGKPKVHFQNIITLTDEAPLCVKDFEHDQTYEIKQNKSSGFDGYINELKDIFNYYLTK